VLRTLPWRLLSSLGFPTETLGVTLGVVAAQATDRRSDTCRRIPKSGDTSPGLVTHICMLLMPFQLKQEHDTVKELHNIWDPVKMRVMALVEVWKEYCKVSVTLYMLLYLHTSPETPQGRAIPQEGLPPLHRDWGPHRQLMCDRRVFLPHRRGVWTLTHSTIPPPISLTGPL
jgi:hypothetical protein